MKSSKFLATMFVTAMMLPMHLSAATLGTVYHQYGSNPGLVDPGGNDVLSPIGVTVSDQSTSPFEDLFDFSGIAATAVVTGLELTLNFDSLGPHGVNGTGETWQSMIEGSNSSGNMGNNLADALSPQTISLNAGTDVGGVDAFMHSLATGKLGLKFLEKTLGADSFFLNCATLTVIGDKISAVPLPAGGLLLLGGLGGLFILRRKGHNMA